MALKMVHPEIEAVGEALDRDQFNTVYAPRGWELMDPGTSYANEHLGRFVRSADDLTKDEARALLAHRGEDYPDADASEDEVRERYAAMWAEGEPVAAPATESATGVPLKPFDPSEHNADKVIQHLENSDDPERARVIAAEGNGKQRKTVLEWAAPAPEQSDESATAADENQE